MSSFANGIITDRYNNTGYWQDRVDRMRRMELESRMRPYSDRFKATDIDSVFQTMSPEDRLTAIDWLIRDNVEKRETGNDDFERVLREGGSKWRVGVRNGVPGLEARVAEGLQDAADAAMALPGMRAGCFPMRGMPPMG